jgi:hypothetical protein
MTDCKYAVRRRFVAADHQPISRSAEALGCSTGTCTGTCIPAQVPPGPCGARRDLRCWGGLDRVKTKLKQNPWRERPYPRTPAPTSAPLPAAPSRTMARTKKRPVGGSTGGPTAGSPAPSSVRSTRSRTCGDSPINLESPSPLASAPAPAQDGAAWGHEPLEKLPEQGQQATQGMGSGGGLALVFWYGALVGVRPVCELVRLSASLSVEFYTCNIKPKTKLVQYLRSTCTGTCTGFGGSGPARPCTLWSNLA